MIHALLTFLGAFTLFLFEPYLGKCLTPRFGGGAQVWVVCLLFFQVVLLAGYAYGDALCRKVPGRLQARVHAILVGMALLASALFLLRGGPAWVGPQQDLPKAPTLELLAGLARGAALPMGLLAATSPLFHHWYARENQGASPFHLYAWSNAGSLAGLLAYPLLVEPWLPTKAQGLVLMVLLGVFGLGVAWISGKAGRSESPEPPAEPIPARTQLLWLIAATLGSAAFMAASAQVTLQVSSLPLLWILPLLAYLATFILIFDARWELSRPALRPLWGGLLLGGFLLSGHSVVHGSRFTLSMISGSLLFTFGGGMLCHGILHARRPGPGGATRFLLLVALGGALGGLAQALLLPLLTDRLYDLGCVALAIALLLGSRLEGMGRISQSIQGAAAVALALVAARDLQATAKERGVFVRNFYGVVRVDRFGPVMSMDNLKTVHGFVDDRQPRQPLTYFTPSSGIGRVLRARMAARPSLRVGVIGLGVGSVACYARAADHYTFYEINPAVGLLAGPGSPVFRLLRDAPSKVELVEGDGRLALEAELREGRPRGFDVLLVDAFTGDSVPWHLITPEAMRVYLDHLAPGGVLVIHVSNPLPVDRIALLSARELGLYGAYLVDVPPGRVLFQWHAKSRFLAFAKEPQPLRDPLILEGMLVGFGPRVFSGQSSESWKLAFLRGDRAWTDARSSTGDLLFKSSVLDALGGEGIVARPPSP